MPSSLAVKCFVVASFVTPPLLATSLAQSAVAQERPKLSPGVAVVRVADTEYTIPVECDDAARPEMGFSTEPSRITQQRTGQTSGVNLRLRTWRDTNLVLISLDRYMTWMERPSSTAGALVVETAMSPVTLTRDGVPTAYTYDMWTSGDRPVALESARFEARCGVGAPVTPSSRKIGAPR